MIKRVIISRPTEFEKKKRIFKECGRKSIHVLSDFDRTLTKGTIAGRKAATLIAELREKKGYLSEDYIKKAHILYEKYHPLEVSPELTRQEKISAMNEWWASHFELLVKEGLSKELIKKVAQETAVELRSGAEKFFSILSENKIPLVIMSASIGDVIVEYLKIRGLLRNNVIVISNFLEFDESGNFLRVKEPIITSMNKNESEIKNTDIYETISKRKNVILLGDSLEDAEMINCFDFERVIKIGFLNEKDNDNPDNYKKAYDVLITGDMGLDFVNNLFEELFR